MPSRPSREPARVVIAVPLASSWIYWKVVAAILALERPAEADLMVFQGAGIDRARNWLVDEMLVHPITPTHIFFLDSDMVPSPDTLTRLLKREAPIVSGLYRKRTPPYEPMAFLKKGLRLQPISLKGPTVRAVDFVGGGCLLIHREVFKKVNPPWFTSEWRKGGHLSEDFSFCEKAKKAGYKIFVDTAVRPLHLEPIGVGTSAKGSVDFVNLA